MSDSKISKNIKKNLRYLEYAVVKYVKHIRLLLISDYIFLSKKKNSKVCIKKNT